MNKQSCQVRNGLEGMSWIECSNMFSRKRFMGRKGGSEKWLLQGDSNTSSSIQVLMEEEESVELLFLMMLRGGH